MATPRMHYIATRGSALALAQANTVLGLCRAAAPGLQFELRIIKTTGDKLQTASLASSELPKGLFTKEIEEALLRQEADLAVHSLKDLPTELPEGLVLGAVLPRADVRDVLIQRVSPTEGAGSRSATGLDGLPQGARVGSSSARRQAQLHALRPDLEIVPIRGNVDTRLRKVAEPSDLQATILAAAGLKRLGFEWHEDGCLLDRRARAGGEAPGAHLEKLRATCLEAAVMLPCVGQAAIGIEVRNQSEAIASLLEVLNDRPTHQCVTAERSFLRSMGGGCQLAVAALAELEGEQMRVRGISFLGEQPRRGEVRGQANEAEALGRQLATVLL
jgi:hydroxymethylbilane synthase